jgi:hypothetical protein
MSKINEKQVKEIADKAEHIGNIAYEKFKRKYNTEAGKLAIAAFRNSLYANSLLIKAEKL